MSAVVRTQKDQREFRFAGVEAKEPNAVQRLHHRGWSVVDIAKMLGTSIASVRADLIQP